MAFTDAPAPISLIIVEDEALIAENLRLTLEDLGYQVLAVCHKYARAAEALATHRPDLVLLDINLGHQQPGRDGLALAQLLSADPAGPPFIFLTAYNDLDTIRRATRLQPSGYLIKPVNPAALFAAIQTAIESHVTREPVALPTSPAASAALVVPPPYFYVKVGDRAHKLFWSRIVSIEAGKNYVTLQDSDSGRTFPLRGTLTYVLDNLLPTSLRPHFIRVNRRTSVNSVFITSYDDDWVYCGDVRHENSPTALRQLQEWRP